MFHDSIMNIFVNLDYKYYILETLYLRHKVTIYDLYIIIYELSFGIMTFDLEWPWQVKSRSNLRKRPITYFYIFKVTNIWFKMILGTPGTLFKKKIVLLEFFFSPKKCHSSAELSKIINTCMLISWKPYIWGTKLLYMTYINSYMNFRLATWPLTLSDLERSNHNI